MKTVLRLWYDFSVTFRKKLNTSSHMRAGVTMVKCPLAHQFLSLYRYVSLLLHILLQDWNLILNVDSSLWRNGMLVDHTFMIKENHHHLPSWLGLAVFLRGRWAYVFPDTRYGGGEPVFFQDRRTSGQNIDPMFCRRLLLCLESLNSLQSFVSTHDSPKLWVTVVLSSDDEVLTWNSWCSSDLSGRMQNSDVLEILFDTVMYVFTCHSSIFLQDHPNSVNNVLCNNIFMSTRPRREFCQQTPPFEIMVPSKIVDSPKNLSL